ncbi:MAG: 3-phenylpropionate/cinnamic acid dioxygenase subunit beta [Candidatus Binataceae bacterium]
MVENRINIPGIEYLILIREIEDFFYHEAELLDERRYEEWLRLFTDDVRYWMPMRKNVAFRDERGDITDENDISWIDDDKLTLIKRVKQLRTGIHWAEEPVSRYSHMVANIRMVDRVENLPEGASLEVSSRFFVYRNRVETETDFLVGRRHDTLRRGGRELRIARRKIILDQSVLMAKNLTVFL